MKIPKLYLLVLCLFLFVKVVAQKNKISGEVEYEQLKITVTGQKKEFYTLHFNGEESYYEENIFDKYKKKMVRKSDGTSVFQPRDNNSPQFFYLNNEGGFYFSEFHISKHLFSKENEDYNVRWKITDETKKIGRFDCQKAVGEFRGRTYHAWFAPEVALGFGPWKLNGLPGLILEAYDESDYIYFTAKKIVILSNNRDSDDYMKMRISEMNFESAMTIDELLVEKEVLIEEYFETLSTRLPKGVGPLKVDKNCKNCGNPLEIFD